MREEEVEVLLEAMKDMTKRNIGVTRRLHHSCHRICSNT